MANYIPKIEYEHPTSGTTTINFELPPQGDIYSESIRSRVKETVTGAGVVQAQFQYFDRSINIKFTFITPTIESQVRDFFLVAGKGGFEFKYFPSNDEVDYFTCILVKPQYKPKRVVREGTDFIYDFDLRMRIMDEL